MRGVPAAGHPVGTAAAMPDLRARRLLRLLTRAPCPHPRVPHRAPGGAVVRAGRGLALVLLRTQLCLSAYPRMTGAQMRALAAHGERRNVARGEVPFPFDSALGPGPFDL